MSTIRVAITGSNVVRDNHWEIPSGSLTPVRTLLIEAGPRNNRQVSQSIHFTGSSWTFSNVTRTASFAEAPDGTMTATFIRENTVNNFHYFEIPSSVTTNIFTGTSIYMKPAGRTRFYVGLNDTSGNYALADITLTGTGSYTGNVTGGTAAVSSVRIVPYSGSWYRVDVVARAASFGSPPFQIQLISASTNSYTGNGTSGVYVWGYNDGDWNRGTEINGIASTMFIRGEGTQTGSRARDAITWTSPAPQPMTVYVRGVIQSTTIHALSDLTTFKILKLGTGTPTGTTTAGLYTNGSTFTSYLKTVSSTVTPSVTLRPGAAVELSMRIYTTGSGYGTQLSYALDGGAVSVGASSSISAGALAATWENGNTLVLCDSDTSSQYAMSFAYRNILIATGSKTLAEMRTLAGI